MKRLSCLATALAGLACGSNPSVIPAGDFSGPSALAIAPVADRDLLFVANQGSNELRAIMLCTAAAGTATTCSDQDDQQFLPAPIRLFPGSIDAGQRPLRLAGARLTTADGTPHGVVLVAGVDQFVRVIDAASVFAASRDRTIASPILPVDVVDPPVDVVTADAQGPSITAIVATQPAAGTPGALTVLAVTLGANGPVVTKTQRCALDFLPTRLAVVPGDVGPTLVYVADGTPNGTPGGIGDGAVEVSVPAIPAIAGAGAPPACPVTRRIPASDPADSPRLARPLRSIALSPPFSFTPAEPDNSPQLSFGPGAILMGVTLEDRALCANHGTLTCPAALNLPAGAVCADHGTRSCGRGRVVLISTNVGGQSALIPAPPTVLNATGAPPLAPLSPPAPAREVAFMISGIRLFNTPTQTTLQNPPLLGVVSAEDGGTYFLDVANRRYMNDVRDTATALPFPTLTSFTLTPVPTSGTVPTLTLAAPVQDDPAKQFAGWVQTGVTRSARWSAVWHATIGGLESLTGSVSRVAGSPTVSLKLPGKSLAPWVNAPEIRLGAPSTCTDPYPLCVGDFVRILSYSPAVSCGGLGGVPSTVDVPIASIDADNLGMQLQAVPGFDPAPECFAGGVLATVEVHAGTTTAGQWTVLEGLDTLTRMPHNAQLVILGPRIDYSFPLGPSQPPPPAEDVALSFTIAGGEPTFATTTFALTFSDAETVTGVRDNSLGNPSILAGQVLVYTSPRRTDPVFFTALTGSNSLAKGIPAQFGVANSDSIRFFY